MKYWTTKEVAERYRTTPATVRYWRHVGYGPRGRKVGRHVLYSDQALVDFERQLTEKEGVA